MMTKCSDCGNEFPVELNSNRYATRICPECGNPIMIEQHGGNYYVQETARPRPKVKLLVIFLLALLIVQPVSASGWLDVDGNGSQDALTDGMLIMRYMFGLRGEALIKDAVSPWCTRCKVQSIEKYLSPMTGQGGDGDICVFTIGKCKYKWTSEPSPIKPRN